MNKKRNVLITVAVILVVLAVGLIYSNLRDRLDEHGVVIPPEKVFIGAKSADTCEAFDIALYYDNSEKNNISFEFSVMPKEGTEVKDFYCSLLTNEWIESYAEFKFPSRGMPKDMAFDIPSESKGFESGWQKYLTAEAVISDEYDSQITAPVRVMLAFDGTREYYLVTPEFKNLDKNTKEQ